MNNSNLFHEAALIGHLHSKISDLKEFERKFHSIPTSSDDRANQFICRIAGTDIADDVEKMFQRIRSTFGLKRKQIEVSSESGWGAVQTPDFLYTIQLELDSNDPSWLRWERSVRNLNHPDIVGTHEFASVFDHLFDRIEFKFENELELESWIDKIEELENDRFQLNYDSALTKCVLVIEGIAAKIDVTGSSCSIIHPKPAPTHQIFKTYVKARDAMSLGFASM